MGGRIRKCGRCGRYTISDRCPKCGSTDLKTPHPPKFSPEDRYLMIRYKFILERRRLEGRLPG